MNGPTSNAPPSPIWLAFVEMCRLQGLQSEDNRIWQAYLAGRRDVAAEGMPSDDILRAGVRAFQSGFNGTDNLSDWREFYRTVRAALAVPSEGIASVAASDGAYEMDDLDRELIEKCRLAVEYLDEGSPSKDVLDLDELDDVIRLIVKLVAAPDESLSRQSSEAAESHLSTRNTAYERAVAQLKQDSARYQWLKERLYGADFQYGEPATSVVVFFWPDTPIGADLDASIDDAMATTEPSPETKL